MRLFLKTFVNKVDKKGRVSVPATFRAAVAHQNAQEIILFPSFRPGNNFLEGCGPDHMENLAEANYSVDVFSDEQDDMAALVFANAAQMPFDSTGRIVLPAELMEHAGITEQAAFVGMGKTFQIWNPDVFAAQQAEARKRVIDKRMTLSIRRDEGGQK